MMKKNSVPTINIHLVTNYVKKMDPKLMEEGMMTMFKL